MRSTRNRGWSPLVSVSSRSIAAASRVCCCKQSLQMAPPERPSKRFQRDVVGAERYALRVRRKPEYGSGLVLSLAALWNAPCHRERVRRRMIELVQLRVVQGQSGTLGERLRE